MIFAIATKPGVVPGARVQRTADGQWLDPGSAGWGPAIPGALFPGKPVSPGDPNGPYASIYTVDVPIGEEPGTYLVFFHGAAAAGVSPPLLDPVPQVVHVPQSQAWQGYAMSPVTYVPVMHSPLGRI